MATKRLLSHLPKSTRERIQRIIEKRDGDLSLHEFLAKRWNVAGFRGDRAAKMRSKLIERHSELSPEQIDVLLAFHHLLIDLKDAAIARRFACEDPGELARGLAIHNRLQLILHGHEGPAGFDELFDMCATRETALAERRVDGVRAARDMVPSDWDRLDIAVTAILQRDAATLKMVTPRLPESMKTARWIAGICTCLIGVDEQNPDKVAEGLAELLAGIHNMRRKDDLDGAINLRAQGLYRLCEWVSSELVAAFDTSQEAPWDAEFHRWCDEHPDPLEGVDLTSVSPVAHEALVLGKPPVWIMFPREPRFEVVVTGGDPHWAKSYFGNAEFLKHCPVVLRWNANRDYADQLCTRINEGGGSAEVRPMEAAPYRLFSEKRGRYEPW